MSESDVARHGEVGDAILSAKRIGKAVHHRTHQTDDDPPLSSELPWEHAEFDQSRARERAAGAYE